MTTTSRTIVKSECSGCMEPFTINTLTFVVTMKVPGNGNRGKGHVPAHTVTAEGFSDGTLILWDCPRCEYADSVYESAKMREEWA